tara:strand:- start:78 stop:740 length:663 start_codon:yes stop_codon:yes gene_type:complete
MEQLLDKKSQLNNNFNDILCILNNIDLKDNSVIDELNNKNKILNESNVKLINEINEKDKIISMNQKTMYDYEKQINSFNEEQEESNKFDMVKAKDKEVHEQNKIIENLNREIDSLKNKLELFSDKNISCDLVDIPDKPEDKVEDNKSEDKVEEQDFGDKEEEDSDDPLEVETIIYRKKEYYMLEEDNKKKVFEIGDDGDLGKEVGLWIDEKLVRPDKKKK